MTGRKSLAPGYSPDMRHSGRPQAVASLLALALLGSCTSRSTDVDTPQQPAESRRTAYAAAGQSGDKTVPPVLRCQDPPASLEVMAKTAIAPHPGPVRAATLVRAARTRTGTWYVIGIDRAYVMDNGTPTGGASRALALTNAPVGVNFIPLADGVTHKPLAVSWDRVSWTSSRLAAGQRALRKAVGCLDAMGDKS
jgi:hypothetical protein